jgi:toxin-antitoxin system PIN domain toxin
MKYLLDVNVLLAAIWVNHPDHPKTDRWIKNRSLVTCPLSELGFLRVSTNPKALRADMKTARNLLEGFLLDKNVEFIAADLPSLKSQPKGSEQVTDFYLAELAAHKGMALATLDTGIGHSAIEIIA